ncbi:MAG: hypothetical protein K2H70_06120, partial [Bacteroidales bacterium]|nr:hypothetical protein [Bacteroidales bacterium]
PYNSGALTENTWFIREVISGHCRSMSSDTIHVEIERYREPAVEIELLNQFCGNEPFSAGLVKAVDTGAAPTYRWFVNGQPMDDATHDTIVTTGVNHGDTICLVVYPDYQGCHCPGPDSVISNRLPVRKSDYIEAFLNVADTVCEQSVVPVGGKFRIGFNENLQYTWYVNGEVWQRTTGTDTLVDLPAKYTTGVDSLTIHVVMDAISGCNGQSIKGYSDTAHIFVNRVKNNTMVGDTTVCEREPVRIHGTLATGRFDAIDYGYLYSRSADGPWAVLITDGLANADSLAATAAVTATGTTLDIAALNETFYLRRIAFSAVDPACADTTAAIELTATPYRHPHLKAVLSTDILCGNDDFSIRLEDSTGYLSPSSTYKWYHWNSADGSITLIGTDSVVDVTGVSTGDRFWCNVTSTEGCVLVDEQATVTDTVTAVYKRNSTVDICGDTIVCAGESVQMWAKSALDNEAVPPTYTWNNGHVGQTQTVIVAAGEPQAYEVTISHPDYCDTVATVIVKSHTLPDSLRLEKNYDTVCSRQNYTCRVLGRPDGLTIEWSTGETTPEINPYLVEGDTLFTVSYRDVNGCLFQAYDSIRIHAKDGRPIRFTASHVPDTAAYNEDTRFSVSVEPKRDDVRYIWYADGVQFKTVYDTGFIFTADEMDAFFNSEDPYRLTCILEDEGFCRTNRDTIYDTILVLQRIYADIQIDANARINHDTIDVCAGRSIRFFAATANAGPVAADGSHLWWIEWFRNGQAVFTGDTLVLSDLKNNDRIYAVLHCDSTMRPVPANSPVQSNTVVVHTIDVLNPVVEIGFMKPLQGGGLNYDTSRYEICELTDVQIRSKIEDAGDNPSIFWYINGAYVSGYDMARSLTLDQLPTTNGQYTNYEVYAKLVSNEYCANAEDSIQTNVLHIGVHPNNHISAELDTLKTTLCQFGDGLQYVELHARVSFDDAAATYTYVWYQNGNILRDAANRPLGDSVLRYWPTTPVTESDLFMMRMFNNALCAAETSVSTDIVSLKRHDIDVEAGNDGEAVMGQPYQVEGDTAYGGAIRWTTGGDGTFDNDAILHPVYRHGAQDSADGYAVLYLTVDDGNTCSRTDSLILKLEQCGIFTQRFLNDTTICRGDFCLDQSLQIPAHVGGITVTYRVDGKRSGQLYEGGEGAYCLPDHQLDEGTYYLTATTSNGCVFRDTVRLDVLPAPSVEHLVSVRYPLSQAAMAMCPGDTATLTLLPPAYRPDLYQYVWSTGDTAGVIRYTTWNIGDTVTLIVTDRQSGCRRDTAIAISVRRRPTISTGNDTVICPGRPVLLPQLQLDNPLVVMPSYEWREAGGAL